MKKLCYFAAVATLVCTAACSEKKTVHVLTTTADRSNDLAESTVGFGKTSDENVVTLDTAVSYQEMDGFGAAITGSAAYNLMHMSDSARTAFLTETFSPTKGYGMSYIRVCIGCSDFSLSEYTCCDTPGIENFALTAEETDYVIPVLKEILAINPDIKILASPWTAPRWMKVEDLESRKPYESWTAGHLNPDFYDDYATYFVKWIEAFGAEGIDIYAVTLQNEPLNPGNSASMVMGWDEQRDFLKHVGPKFEEAGIQAKIYAFDHNYNYDNKPDQFRYPLNIYADSVAASYLAGAAYHNYGGTPAELDSIHAARPDKELVFTESTAGFWNDGQNLDRRLAADMDDIILGTVNRNSRGSIIWNLMLDENRGPNRPGGCTTGFGAVDISDNYTKIQRNSFYYIMAHAASAVKPGAHRISATGEVAPGLGYAAFRNPDGTLAILASNSSDAPQNLTISAGNEAFTLSLPEKSIVSATW
ncbi:MAG: glucosylceramidase [Bacteroidales bacterium]|nr:glucosylceramidase [Bacteroidales bacterium]